MGGRTRASGNSSVAFGYQSSATSSYAEAMGFGLVASGSHSLAFGNMPNASGSASTAIGLK